MNPRYDPVVHTDATSLAVTANHKQHIEDKINVRTCKKCKEDRIKRY